MGEDDKPASIAIDRCMLHRDTHVAEPVDRLRAVYPPGLEQLLISLYVSLELCDRHMDGRTDRQEHRLKPPSTTDDYGNEIPVGIPWESHGN